MNLVYGSTENENIGQTDWKEDNVVSMVNCMCWVLYYADKNNNIGNIIILYYHNYQHEKCMKPTLINIYIFCLLQKF